MTRRQLYLTSFTMSLSVVSYPFFYPVTTGAMKMGLFFFHFFVIFFIIFFYLFFVTAFCYLSVFLPRTKKNHSPAIRPNVIVSPVICPFFYPGLKNNHSPAIRPNVIISPVICPFFLPCTTKINHFPVICPHAFLSPVSYTFFTACVKKGPSPAHIKKCF